MWASTPSTAQCLSITTASVGVHPSLCLFESSTTTTTPEHRGLVLRPSHMIHCKPSAGMPHHRWNQPSEPTIRTSQPSQPPPHHPSYLRRIKHQEAAIPGDQGHEPPAQPISQRTRRDRGLCKLFKAWFSMPSAEMRPPWTCGAAVPRSSPAGADSCSSWPLLGQCCGCSWCPQEAVLHCYGGARRGEGRCWSRALH